MFDILWLVMCVIIAAPMIINPNKIIERPGCKIKSPGLLRAIAIFVIFCGIFQLLI